MVLGPDATLAEARDAMAAEPSVLKRKPTRKAPRT
jgi:hypothetical protein